MVNIGKYTTHWVGIGSGTAGIFYDMDPHLRQTTRPIDVSPEQWNKSLLQSIMLVS